MKKQVLWGMIGIIFFTSGYSLDQGATEVDHNEETQVRVLLEQVLKDKPGDKETKVTLQEVEKAPGAATELHRHPAPVFVYILEGELESQIDDEKPKVYKKGDVFYEPHGALHKVARNPSKTSRLRFLAVFLSTKGEKELLIPEKR